jgi:hypothetical protein
MCPVLTHTSNVVLSLLQSIHQAMTHSDIDLALMHIDVYIRLLLHKSVRAQGVADFSSEINQILVWSTDKVVPALKLSHSATVPFEDPDISHISVEKSLDITAPLSPLITGPLRSRRNHLQTPLKDDVDGDISRQLTSPVNREIRSLMSYVSISTLRILGVIFSEWIAIEGYRSNVVAKAAVAWCSVLDHLNEDDCHAFQSILSRLIIQLCKRGEFDALSELIFQFERLGVKADDSIVRKLMALLTSSRGNQSDSLVSGSVCSVMCAAHRYISDNHIEISSDAPTCIEDLWPAHSSSMCAALESIMSCRLASLKLAEHIIAILSCSPHDLCVRELYFDLKCLCHLAHNPNVGQDVQRLSRQLDGDLFQHDAGAKSLFDYIVIEQEASRIE